MIRYNGCESELSEATLQMHVLGDWLNATWMVEHAARKPLLLLPPKSIVDLSALEKFAPDFKLAGDYHFVGLTPAECSVALRMNDLDFLGKLTHQTGANRYTFARDDERVEVMVAAAYYSDEVNVWRLAVVAAVPQAFIPAWHTFTEQCDKLSNGLETSDKVVVIGGTRESFEPKVTWDEIVLPDKLKHELMEDVSSFFTKGVDVYRRLNLKPFRKLLLAGVPGTGKTMMCSALAKWGLEQHYLVIYVSSAVRRQGTEYASSFEKIEEALAVAANSELPTLILLEELDAYLHETEKALVLNVLDGNESKINEKGTLLIATTNYPEAIDERVLKRPGRLDRIFIIPETKAAVDAEKMLRQYLGSLWQDAHKALIPALVGYPGAFIREIAVHALTQCAYDDLTELSLDLLEQSFDGLKAQLEARDDFLKKRGGMMFTTPVNIN